MRSSKIGKLGAGQRRLVADAAGGCAPEAPTPGEPALHETEDVVGSTPVTLAPSLSSRKYSAQLVSRPRGPPESARRGLSFIWPKDHHPWCCRERPPRACGAVQFLCLAQRSPIPSKEAHAIVFGITPPPPMFCESSRVIQDGLADGPRRRKARPCRPARMGAEQIDGLDARLEQRAVDAAFRQGAPDRAGSTDAACRQGGLAAIDGLAEDVEHPPQKRVAHRNPDRRSGVRGRAAQAATPDWGQGPVPARSPLPGSDATSIVDLGIGERHQARREWMAGRRPESGYRRHRPRSR